MELLRKRPLSLPCPTPTQFWALPGMVTPPLARVAPSNVWQPFPWRNPTKPPLEVIPWPNGSAWVVAVPWVAQRGPLPRGCPSGHRSGAALPAARSGGRRCTGGGVCPALGNPHSSSSRSSSCPAHNTHTATLSAPPQHWEKGNLSRNSAFSWRHLTAIKVPE